SGEPGDGTRLDRGPDAWASPSGVVLSFGRWRAGEAPLHELVVADAAGRVRALVRKEASWDAGCWMTSADVRDGAALIGVRGDGTTGHAVDSPIDRLVLLDVATGEPALAAARDDG